LQVAVVVVVVAMEEVSKTHRELSEVMAALHTEVQEVLVEVQRSLLAPKALQEEAVMDLAAAVEAVEVVEKQMMLMLLETLDLVAAVMLQEF
jgi:hypothetical protein